MFMNIQLTKNYTKLEVVKCNFYRTWDHENYTLNEENTTQTSNITQSEKSTIPIN